MEPQKPVVKSSIEYSVRLVRGPDLAPSEIEALVALHQAAFPGFFLTSLGPRFLRALYRGFLESEKGVCAVAQAGQRLLGFAMGTAKPDSFFRVLLRKKGMSFAWAALPGLLQNPVFVVRKSLSALFYRGERPKVMPGAGLLSSLAVSPHVAGKGIGQQLVSAFCEELARRGADAVYLITDASDNDSVNRFYAKCGFRLVDTFERPGKRLMNRWAKTLQQPSERPEGVL